MWFTWKEQQNFSLKHEGYWYQQKNFFGIKIACLIQVPNTFQTHPFLSSPSPVFIALDKFLISGLSISNS